MAPAAIALWQAQDLPIGRAMKMGPGYFPRVLAGAVGVFGLIMMAMSAFVPGPKLDRWSFGGLALVMGAIVFFAFAVRALGLVFTSAGLVAIATVAAPGLALEGGDDLRVCLVVFASILFPKGSACPLPLWPWP